MPSNIIYRISLSSGTPIAAMLALAMPTLSGCKSLQAQSRVDPQTIAIYDRRPEKKGHKHGRDPISPGHCATKAAADTHRGAIDLDCFQFPEDRSTDPTMPPVWTAYKLAVNDPLSRNRLGAILMKQSDDICTVELGRLVADEATVNTTLSILMTAFATTSSLVGGETAKSILSGIAATTSASRDHINAEIYRNVLSTAVARAIRTERKLQHNEIVKKLKGGMSTADYTVDQMIAEINEYHQTCSFYRGLGLVVEAVDRADLAKGDHTDSIRLALDAIDDRDAVLVARLTKSPNGVEAEADKKELADNRTQRTALMATLTALPTTTATK